MAKRRTRKSDDRTDEELRADEAIAKVEDRARRAAERERRRQEELAAFLRPGLQARLQRAHGADIYSVSGPDRTRETAVDRRTFVRPLLDPRLKLSPRERATGTCYGTYVERTFLGPGEHFIKEYVDSSTRALDHSERQADIVNMVMLAEGALLKQPPVTFTFERKRRSRGQRGEHRPIAMIHLARGVCVDGKSLELIGLSAGWWIERKREGSESGQRKLPVRQRKKLAEALKEALEIIGAVWERNGYNIPYALAKIDVE